MSRRIRVAHLTLVLALIVAALAVRAERASANDAYPCGTAIPVDWSPEQVHPCPLTSPLPPNGWVPVYSQPVASPQGAPPPPAAGWLHGTTDKYFVCDRPFPSAVYYHPSGWRNIWWAYTKSDDGVWGWVPEVFFRGGDDDERDDGMEGSALCADTPPQPPAPPPAPPADHSCNPTPAATGLRLTAAVRREGARRSHRVVTASYQRRLRASGRLRDANGAPIAGASLCVVTGEALAGASPQPMGTVVTDAQGRFSYELASRRSTRVWFVHRAGDAAAAASVLLRVRAPVVLHVSRHTVRTGQIMTFRGHVKGTGNFSGFLAEIQASRLLGWQTFRSVRMRADGSFRVRYRFARTTGVASFHLRAFVNAQRGLPFAAGASRPVRVRVRGL